MVAPLAGTAIGAGVTAAIGLIPKAIQAMSTGNRRRWFRNHPDKAREYALSDPEAASFIKQHEPKLFNSFSQNPATDAQGQPGGGGVPNQRTGNAFTGYNAYTQQLPTKSPEQIGAINALLPGTVQKLKGNEFDFAPIEEKGRRDFQKYTIPSLANRFSAFGGGLSTDAYQNAMGAAHAEHELGLSGLKSEYGLKQQTQQQNLLNTLLSPQYENIYLPGTTGALSGFTQQAAPALGKFATDSLSEWLNSKSDVAGKDKTQEVIDALTTKQAQQKYDPAQSQQPAQNVLGGGGVNQSLTGLKDFEYKGLANENSIQGMHTDNWIKDLLSR